MLTGTAHFSVAEALNASGGAIPDALADNAQAVLEWLESARVYLGRPILLTSLYRSPAKNAATPGAANDSQHTEALAADFDVIGMVNHEAAAAIVAGIQDGSIPTPHQIITYTTDHHLHVGIAGEQWGADGTILLEVASGQYQALSYSQLAELAGSATVADKIVATAAQAGDAATLHPAIAILAVGLFLTPGLLGGHWT